MDHILVHVYPEFTKDIVSPVNMLEIVLHSIKLLKKPRLGVSNDLEEWEWQKSPWGGLRSLQATCHQGLHIRIPRGTLNTSNVEAASQIN